MNNRPPEEGIVVATVFSFEGLQLGLVAASAILFARKFHSGTADFKKLARDSAYWWLPSAVSLFLHATNSFFMRAREERDRQYMRSGRQHELNLSKIPVIYESAVKALQSGNLQLALDLYHSLNNAYKSLVSKAGRGDVTQIYLESACSEVSLLASLGRLEEALVCVNRFIAEIEGQGVSAYALAKALNFRGSLYFRLSLLPSNREQKSYFTKKSLESFKQSFSVNDNQALAVFYVQFLSGNLNFIRRNIPYFAPNPDMVVQNIDARIPLLRLLIDACLKGENKDYSKAIFYCEQMLASLPDGASAFSEKIYHTLQLCDSLQAIKEKGLLEGFKRYGVDDTESGATVVEGELTADALEKELTERISSVCTLMEAISVKPVANTVPGAHVLFDLIVYSNRLRALMLKNKVDTGVIENVHRNLKKTLQDIPDSKPTTQAAGLQHLSSINQLKMQLGQLDGGGAPSV